MNRIGLASGFRTGISTATVLILAALVPCAASAQGWFAGGGVSQTKQYDYSVGSPVINKDDTDTGLRVFGGYQFLPWASAVLSYVDLGTPFYKDAEAFDFTDSLEANAFDVSVVAGAPLGEMVSFFGTVGIFHFTQKVRYSDEFEDFSADDTGTGVSFGAGMRLKFGTVWGMHLGFQRFPDVGDKNKSGHEYDRDLYEVGAEYFFGR